MSAAAKAMQIPEEKKDDAVSLESEYRSQIK
jgi:hypothetical protein